MFKAAQCIDKYILHQRLGRNEYTEVWRALDSHLQRDVIIKAPRFPQRISADERRSFQRRARKVAGLQHPNIAQIYDISVDGYIVMQDVQGPTLASYLAQNARVKKIPGSREIVQMLIAIGSAVDYAQQQKVVCGRIRPVHILLDQQNKLYPLGEPVLAGFDFWQRSEAGVYQAPEQLKGNPASAQGDLYALGVMLYELYTGELPFVSSEASLANGLALPDVPIPPSHWNHQISPELEAILLRGIAPEAEERFPDARSLIAALVQASGLSVFEIPHMEYHRPYLSTIEALIRQERNRLAAREQGLSRQDLVSDTKRSAAGKSSDELRRAPVLSGKNGPSLQQRQSGLQLKERESATSGIVPLLSTHKLALATLVSILLIVAMIFWPLWFGRTLSYGSPSGPTHTFAFSGNVQFMSSRLGDSTKNQGINDTVRVALTHVALPASGKSYYAWLQADARRSDSSVILLGRLQITQTTAQLLYTDPQHTDLLTTMSGFLVTEEDAGEQPVNPTLDTRNWRAVGAIPQQPAPNDLNHYSLLDHLRHLLAVDPELEALGLQDGLATWLNVNTQQVQELAQDIQQRFTAKDASKLRDDLVSIVDYLDGIKDANKDVPAGTPFLVDALSARVGLLQIHANQDPQPYLYHIGIHLLSLVSSPGVSSGQQKIARDITTGINTAQGFLEQIRTDVQQLLAFSPAQLLQPARQSQLNTLALLATQSYSGQGSAFHGISSLVSEMETLASIQVMAYGS